MKQLITLLLVCVSYLSLAAAEGTIELNKSELDREARSITNTLKVTYDDTILRIYSDVPLENLTITVSDIYNGEIIYCNTVTIFSKQTYFIQLNIESTYISDYRIELKSSLNAFYGFFSPSK